jgi:hypothetical protein
MIDAAVWAVGRLGARSPMYGPLNTVIPAEMASRWIETLLGWRQTSDSLPFAMMQLARRTSDRYRDIAEPLRREVVDWLTARQAAAHLIQLVAEGGELAEDEQGQMFGESLPRGLRIANWL